jgi:hypothetical protein
MGELINYYIIESGLIKERTNSLITSLGFSIVIFEICSYSLISFFVGFSLIINDYEQDFNWFKWC